jgi:hypothetical protein
MSYISGGWRRPSYITLNQELTLAAEQQHVNLVAPDVHPPIQHTGLLGVDPHIPSIHGVDRHTDTVRMLWIPAELWFPSVVAAGALANIADTPVYNMPDGAAEQIVAFMRLPIGADMATIALRLYLATDAAAIAAGNVTIVSELTGYAVGDSIGAAGGGVTQDIPFPNSGGGISTLLFSGLLLHTPLPPGIAYDYFAIAITRRGDLGVSDTYTGDCNIVALEAAFTFES